MNKKTSGVLLGIVLTATGVSAESLSVSDESKGAVVGATLGALLGGPAGLVLGAGGGALLGHAADLQHALDGAEQELAARASEEQGPPATMVASLEPVASNGTAERLTEQRRGHLDQLSRGLSLSIHFRTGSDELQPHLKSQLVALSRLLEAFPELQVHLEGHADARGRDDHNRMLSAKRVESVARLFESEGLAAPRVRRTAFGETRPVSETADVDGFAFDRRVVIRLLPGQITSFGAVEEAVASSREEGEQP